MAGPTERKRPVSWAFDAIVMVAGVSIALLALLGVLAGDDLDRAFWICLLVGAPMIGVMARFPLVLDRDGGGIEIGFDSAVLVFLAVYGEPPTALAVWAVGQVLSQLSRAKRLDVRVFNVGLGTLAGCAALVAMLSISPLLTRDPQELFAVGVGCAVYFLVDYVVSAISIALEESTPVSRELRQVSGLALGVFVAIDSLGYLAALVARGLPRYANILLAVPVLTILVATRALSRGNEHRRRLGALFEAAAAAQAVQSRDELEDVLRTHARRAVLFSGTDLREEAPTSKEIGARVRTGGHPLWLVSPMVKRARASITADQRALETLATVGEEAFARLRLVGEMGRLARHDSLTGRPNRVLFLDRVEQVVARSRRQGQRLAVLFLDLDGFKSVNDRFGHAEGDELLKTVAARLVGCVRAVDSVARLGGDEFAVLVEGVTDLDEVDLLCRRLLSALRREITIAGHDVVVGASIGVAVSTGDDDGAGLLRNADMAMYRAKALGKDQFFVYQPSLREANIKRLELIEALRTGVAHDLVVHYQPVVDLERGRIDGLEALVRWNRNGVLVPPDAFISAAEESGLIVALGERVLAQIVEDVPLLAAAAGRPLNLGCNMSAMQLNNQSFLEQVARAVTRLEERDCRLVLEMTESIVVADDRDTADALHTLKAVGALLAIDDFGVGFSSIGYLQHLPVDILKIDRSFTRDVDTNDRAAALVEAILVMGQALDLRVVAEGIEREEQATRLRGAGCEVGQGYLYGRPQPLDDVLRMLRSGLTTGLAAATTG
ncbi:MAG: putative bifunctional diguanylate cyclase/phosphodiesterase [Actinomycetes bacterium]